VNYIYIGDFGNNAGTRTDLKVYRVDISDYFTNDTVNAEIIHFTYADQTNFSNQIYAHNFDAEALISIGDSLYIFTKIGLTQSLISTAYQKYLAPTLQLK